MRLWLNIVGDDETNFAHKLLLTDRQVENIHKTFANKSSTDIGVSKIQLSKMVQSEGFLGRLLGPLLKTGLPLIKNVIKPSAKSVLITLGLTAAAAVVYAGIHKKTWGSGRHHCSSSAPHNKCSSATKTTTLITSNDEMKAILEIVKSFKDSGLLLKGVSETFEIESKEQKRGFLSMLLGILGASLSGKILSNKKEWIGSEKGL